MRIKLWFIMITATALFCVTELTAYSCNASVEIRWPSEEYHYAFNSESPGKIKIDCIAVTVPSGRESEITWTCKSIGGTTTTFTNTDIPGRVTLTLSGLPNNNSSFGDFWIKASLGSASDTHTIKLFFSGGDTVRNHPGEGSGVTPNWYYYWCMTGANAGTHEYKDGPRSHCILESNTWKVYIANDADATSLLGAYDNAKGIDFFAHTCRHEERHRLDLIAFWGSNYDAARDLDMDNIPSEYESNDESNIGLPYHPPGYSSAHRLTPGILDHFNYGDDFSDLEDYCMHRQASWANGIANDVDWSNSPHPKQYY